ncbi:MAG: hypothetical protein WA715_08550 [Candidatus Acidiferrum sp.]|jgi:hypothetical protein
MSLVLEDELRDPKLDVELRDVTNSSKTQVMLGSGSLALAAIEAACLFFVSANGLSVLLGGAVVGLAQSSARIHTASIRLPLLGLAALGAFLNLWLLVNSWRLRNAPAARWRKKPLLPSERRRNILVAALSILTLLIVGAELFLHHRFHGSAFASNSFFSSEHDG